MRFDERKYKIQTSLGDSVKSKLHVLLSDVESDEIAN